MKFIWCLIAACFAIDARAAHPIPPAAGPNVHLPPSQYKAGSSFKSSERIVGTYYFYWYDFESRLHILNPEDGSDGLTDHPPKLRDISYKSVAWHKKQLQDMMDAGIDLLLCVFWGAPSEHGTNAPLHWSYAGLPPLVEAREQLIREGAKPPAIGLFYDTSTLQYNDWHEQIDLTTERGQQWFYATVRDFFSMIPPQHWARLDGKPIMLMYAAAFVKNHDQRFIDYTRSEFAREFGGSGIYIAPQDSWHVKGDNICAWGGALGERNPGIGELGPGYNDSAVYGRKPLIADRRNGQFYGDNWKRFLRHPSNFVMIETWSEFHEGTEICESREYGRQYIELTRKFVDQFKNGVTVAWPKGPFTARAEVDLAAGLTATNGLSLVQPEDGHVTRQKKNGRDSWMAKPFSGSSAFIYFKIDDSFKHAGKADAMVEVTYLDNHAGNLSIEFDGSDAAAPFGGVYSRSNTIRTSGDKQWKRATFELPGAFFTNGQNGEADLRVAAEMPEIAVGAVTVRYR